jgi:cell pole-organizing protein PopZ
VTTEKTTRTRKPKVVALDAPSPAVVDRLAEQQAALYATHPDVVAQAKAYAAQRLADAQATEAEAKAKAVEAMAIKLQSEATAAKVVAVIDGRTALLAQHTGLCAAAQRILMQEKYESFEDARLGLERARVFIALATELRLAQRDS